MTFIVPFDEKFCGEIITIYAVNNDNPKDTFQSSVTTSEICPHCNERNVFRVYEHKHEREEAGYFFEVYDCKCPSCRKRFDLEVKFEI